MWFCFSKGRLACRKMFQNLNKMLPVFNQPMGSRSLSVTSPRAKLDFFTFDAIMVSQGSVFARVDSGHHHRYHPLSRG